MRFSTLVAFLISLAALSYPGSVPADPTSPQASGEEAHWVFFADKGARTEAEERRAIDEAWSSFTERARSRRMSVGSRRTGGYLDLPLNEGYLDDVRDMAIRVRARSRWLNAVSVDVAGERELRQIRELPFVAATRRVAQARREPFVAGPPILRRAPAALHGGFDYGESSAQILQLQVDQLHGLGLSGEGVLIGIFDTGFVLNHVCFDSLDVQEAWDFVNDDPIVEDEPEDVPGQHGHGSAVLSILAGFDPGNLIGPAFGASYLLGKTESVAFEEPVEEDYWIAALEWADSLGVDLVTSSLGYKDWYTWEDLDGNTAPITIAADLAVANGISVLTSAGNEGTNDWTYVLTPADGDSVIAVGAVDSLGVRVDFSSIGPTWDGRIKPDICAMGTGTLFAVPASTDEYGHGSGTSVACPLAAGVAALLLEAHPLWGPIEIREALRTTGTQASSPDNLMGWEIIQGADALGWSTEAPLASRPTAQALRISPNPSSTLSLIRWPERLRRPAEIEIFDARGRLVRRLAGHEGAESAAWDGRDASEKLLPTGVYFARLRAGGFEAAARIVRIR